ncbi:tRNA (adenine(58)-N(1))-methyltransferase non-catalytic subunit TRM6 [Chamberlinius hualienensis]
MAELTDMDCDDLKIKDGDHVILIRGDIKSTCRVVKSKKVYFKHKKFFLNNAIGCYYGSTFKISGSHLQVMPNALVLEENNGEDNVESNDNRDINDDGKSQKLSTEEIESLKGKGLSGEEIVDTIIENSQTFKNKNEYSKIKYIKKKNQKYSDQVKIVKPTSWRLVEMYHSQGSLKILGLRMDSLALMLTMCNVFPGGKYIVVDGCLGLVTGSVLERLGGLGKLVNVYFNSPPQYPVLPLYNFTDQHIQCLSWINIDVAIKSELELTNGEKKISNSGDLIEAEEEGTLKQARRKQRLLQKMEASDILKQRNMDGLIIASKHHPLNVLRALLPLLESSRRFVVFCPYQQPLIECWSKLKEDGNILVMNVSDNFFRPYQVLPNRTHPMITGSGCGGYILSGIKV